MVIMTALMIAGVTIIMAEIIITVTETILMEGENTEETIMTMVASMTAGENTEETIMTMVASMMAGENTEETIMTMAASMMAEDTMIMITALLMEEENMTTIAIDKTTITMVVFLMRMGDSMATTMTEDEEMDRKEMYGTSYGMHLGCS